MEEYKKVCRLLRPGMNKQDNTKRRSLSLFFPMDATEAMVASVELSMGSLTAIIKRSDLLSEKCREADLCEMAENFLEPLSEGWKKKVTQ
jgi:hypothetical protein